MVAFQVAAKQARTMAQHLLERVITKPGSAFRTLARALLASLVAVVLIGGSPGDRLEMPQISAEPDWMHLPEGMLLGNVSAVAVDREDNVWVLHRPGSLSEADRPNAAPPVMKFDSAGRYLGGFGGPGSSYDWPTVEHSLALDGKDRVWIAGSFRGSEGPADDMLLAFATDGRFLLQIGRPGASAGNGDVSNLHAPADIFVDDAADEVYVADGYGNSRLIVYDGRTGAFRRMWGAFGKPAAAATAPQPRRQEDQSGLGHSDGPEGFNGVHGVEISRDGRVYVSDRNNQRVQIFTRKGRYLGQTLVNPSAPPASTASGMAFSSDRLQRYLYIVDWSGNQILVYDRRRLVQLGAFAGAPTPTGRFRGPHLIASDSHGRIFVAEVRGRRVQRLTVR